MVRAQRGPWAVPKSTAVLAQRSSSDWSDPVRGQVVGRRVLDPLGNWPIATFGGDVVVADSGGGVWRLAPDGVVRWQVHREPAVDDLAFSADGTLLATVDTGGDVVLLDASTGTERARLPVDAEVGLSAVAFQGDWLWVGGYAHGWLWRLDPTTGAIVARGEGGPTRIYDVAPSPVGDRVVAVDEDGVATLLDTDAEVVGRVQAHYRNAACATWSPDGSWFATGGADGALRLWDPGSLDALADLPAHRAHIVWACATSPSGRLLATGGGDDRTAVWRMDSLHAPGAAMAAEAGRVLGLEVVDGRLVVRRP